MLECYTHNIISKQHFNLRRPMTIWMIFDPLFDLQCTDMTTRHCKGATVLSYTYKTIGTKYLINARSHKRCHKVDHYFF